MLVIIFSYNRALQLEYLLQSIFNNLEYVGLKLVVVYNCSGSHESSYRSIANNFKDSITFVKETSINNSLLHALPSLFIPLNLFRYLKHNKLRKYSTNFKFLLDDLIFRSNEEFVMFCTDDGYFYRKVAIPDTVLQLIRDDPANTSYKMYVGLNCSDYQNVARIRNNCMVWDYYHPGNKGHWRHPFAVDCTLYSRKFISGLLKKIWYTNPNTLEGMVNGYVKMKKYLRNGFSPKISNYYCIPINMVQQVSDNYAGRIHPDYLNELYLQNYRLDLKSPDTIGSKYYYPEKLILIRGDRQLAIETNFNR